MMPGADGLEILSRIRSDPERSETPFSGIWSDPPVRSEIRPMLEAATGAG